MAVVAVDEPGDPVVGDERRVQHPPAAGVPGVEPLTGARVVQPGLAAVHRPVEHQAAVGGQRAAEPGQPGRPARPADHAEG